MSNVAGDTNALLTLMTAALMSWTSRGLSSMTYLDESRSAPSQTMAPETGGASLSGEEISEALLNRLSFEDFGVNMFVYMVRVFLGSADSVVVVAK